ncbi:hypothetical protein DF047_32900 [Burkholderia cenocepacia]|nr:hypothetical protein DF047_32900 [Burkholderia cenocepacia]
MGRIQAEGSLDLARLLIELLVLLPRRKLRIHRRLDTARIELGLFLTMREVALPCGDFCLAITKPLFVFGQLLLALLIRHPQYSVFKHE